MRLSPEQEQAIRTSMRFLSENEQYGDDWSPEISYFKAVLDSQDTQECLPYDENDCVRNTIHFLEENEQYGDDWSFEIEQLSSLRELS